MNSLRRPVIGGSEAVALLFIFLTSRIFLAHTSFVLDDGMNASWMIPLANTAIAVAVVFLLASVLEEFPGNNLIETGERLAGPYLNLMFGVYYILIFVVNAGLTLRQASEWVLAGFLPDTPISLVSMLFIFGSLVVAYLGAEALARTAKFLFKVIIITAFSLVLLSIPFWQEHALYPLWGGGLQGILAGIYKNAGDFVYILLLGIIYPFLPGGTVSSVGVRGVVLAGLFMFLFTLIHILVFTFPTVKELTLPTLEVARLISIGRFGQRMEILFLPVWVFGNLVFLSASLYGAAAVLAGLSRLTDVRPFVLAVTVLAVVVAFIPQNAPQASEWNYLYINRFSFAGLLAILLILYLAAWRKGRGDGFDKGGS